MLKLLRLQLAVQYPGKRSESLKSLVKELTQGFAEESRDQLSTSPAEMIQLGFASEVDLDEIRSIRERQRQAEERWRQSQAL